MRGVPTRCVSLFTVDPAAYRHRAPGRTYAVRSWHDLTAKVKVNLMEVLPRSNQPELILTAVVAGLGVTVGAVAAGVQAATTEDKVASWKADHLP